VKSEVRAWVLFAFVLVVPTAVLGLLGLYAGDAEAARVQGDFFARRVEATTDVRQKVELAMYHALDSLRALPSDASYETAQTELASASIPFASGYISRRGDIVTVVSPPPGGSAADERLRAATDAFLKSDSEEARIITRVLVSIGNDGKERPSAVSFTRSDDCVVVSRSFHAGITVGWIFDLESMRHGADGVLPADFAFAPSTMPEGLASREPSAAPKPQWPPPAPSAHTFYFTRKPGKVTMGATAEDQSKIIVDRDAKNLVFQIVAKDPSELARRAFRARVWIVGVTFGCLAFFVVMATVLFARARRAKRLADLRTDFVAAVSHELRTPLASVRMFAELLEAGDVPEDERAEVEQALAGETRRLHATLDRMLRYGALARGKLVLAKEMRRLEPIAREAAAKRNVTLDVPEDLEANVDAGMLTLALDNLLSNAVKYAPEGGPYVVRARAEGDDLLLSVTDHGPGLSKKAQKTVFLPFERADQRLSKATEGSGVGLALVRGIARAHGGDASVDSELGQGATFTLRLPRT
jgi:two-component system phosphate regulon sensor histidine kinase PhoR